jgi:ADP-ribosylglycohydrolase
MLGAIAGDVVGSVYEGTGFKSRDFPLFTTRSTFTDDTVLTIAVASAILDGRNYDDALRDFANRYAGRGYGWRFYQWVHRPTMGPYKSWGNGSAMRVSPVAWAFDSVETVLSEARKSAAVTHNHRHGIRGAQATALAVFLARTGAGKDEIRHEIARRFKYRLSLSVDQIRPGYHPDVSCRGSVPESIVSFLDAGSYEETLRNAISLGGDADTMACIAGGIAEAHYGGLPEVIEQGVRERLPEEFIGILDRFRKRFPAASS